MQNYELGAKLGEGTFAVVYEARRRRDGLRAAVKKIKAEQSDWQQCLRIRELRSLKTIGHHPNIIRLHELILDRRSLYFVFEFCATDLHRWTTSLERTNACGMSRAAPQMG